MLHFFQPWQWVLVLFFTASFIVVFWVLPFWFICKKAGFSPWLTLLNCIPFGTVVLICLLAFAEWRQKIPQRTATILEMSAGPQPVPSSRPVPSGL